MISLQQASGRSDKVTLAPLSLDLDTGLHALVGGALDGPALVLALIAGDAALRGGHVSILGFGAGDPTARAAIGYVSLDPPLPSPMRVDDALATAASLRGETTVDPVARLDVLGLRSLASRPVSSLAHEERRAVALAEAITSNAAVLLVEEPFVRMDPRAALRARALLAQRAQGGASVIVATASIRAARDLAGDLLIFDRGVIVARTGASDPILFESPRGASFRVVASAPDALAAALAAQPACTSVAVERGAVVARGPDSLALAAAITYAADEAAVTVVSLCPVLLDASDLRSAIRAAAARPTLAHGGPTP